MRGTTTTSRGGRRAGRSRSAGIVAPFAALYLVAAMGAVAVRPDDTPTLPARPLTAAGPQATVGDEPAGKPGSVEG
jgi:hypothetical protein